MIKKSYFVFLLFFLALVGCQTIPDTENSVLAPYRGSSIAGVDTSTLTGKVMCGYQGWFNAEGDGSGLGWVHWARRRDELFGPDNVGVDIWPDMREYSSKERYATGFSNADGSIAEVFSSHDRGTVLRHFEWMRDYGIDGAFIQRFANGLRRPEFASHKDVVLAHAREGANRNGRAYAVMYDLSGLPKGGVDRVRLDWIRLRNQMQVTDDSAYLKHEGRPLVSVWGVGFSDRGKPREYTLEECRDLVAFLKEDGCSVMLGVPTQWRDGGRDATTDPLFHEILEMADVVSPWTVGRYRDEVTVVSHSEKYWQPDESWCEERSLDYFPVVFPGFSWYHLKGGELGQIPRRKGAFLWSQIAEAKRSGSDMIYVAMFDEVDEGTAIFKCVNNPPSGDGLPFLDYEGLPSDYYLKLVGEAGRLLRGERDLAEGQPEW
ncbi:MAG: xylosidase/arabinosidase [Opitutales bacterium]|nr:xylosidase/arabinosidase [Opitutales bacterium]